MAMKGRMAIFGIILGGFLIAGFLLSNPLAGNPALGREDGVLPLARPALAQGAGTSFLEKEAGITAYINLGRAIDLAAVKAKFRTVEKETADYVVGSVALPGYESKDDIHAFVTREGWVAGYYGKAEPASKIIDWKNYTRGGGIVPNKLSLGLAQLQLGLAIVPGSLKYYHYAYSEANRMYAIADSDIFYITIPSQLRVFESSYSGPYCLGRLTFEQLLPDVRHEVKLSGERLHIDGKVITQCGYYGDQYCGLALVYREP